MAEKLGCDLAHTSRHILYCSRAVPIITSGLVCPLSHLKKPSVNRRGAVAVTRKTSYPPGEVSDEVPDVEVHRCRGFPRCCMDLLKIYLGIAIHPLTSM